MQAAAVTKQQGTGFAWHGISEAIDCPPASGPQVALMHPALQQHFITLCLVLTTTSYEAYMFSWKCCVPIRKGQSRPSLLHHLM